MQCGLSISRALALATPHSRNPRRNGRRGTGIICSLTARCGDEIVGWAALSPVSRRTVYAGVAEVSVYVAARVRGQGVGMALLSAIMKASERAGIWTLQGGVFPENTASLALLRKAGFRVVGTRKRVGCMDGRWRDVMLLERRSRVAGV